ncbi:siroheme decarboxylase subunit beta [Varunaivibrio sulfuroxidans]|uniref:siroheme decarboxylase n=1 Tax=Varunaivibrio sulfuroxidans TaxID=1773489 RepID=A0A4V2UNE5_9PROT|nr:AsnC family transcriptional regulator [Varunaivibrio sulfuroxidans]TCS61791.1 AsnC family transcriptional regulator [Varunaivibrio sulfuroxidans]WES32026.1 AsnC family transcriptional regulator [Varunaivibrio sulfuroxidans]
MTATTPIPTPIDAIDRALIRATQDGLPLHPRPYDAVGRAVGIPGGEVRARMDKMLASGIIRRIGAVPNHYRLGYRVNAMTVWDVADDALVTLGPAVGALAFVSHCYRRPRAGARWPYNLFAMVHGKDRAGVDRHIDDIRRLLGAAAAGGDVLLSTEILKKTGLRL